MALNLIFMLQLKNNDEYYEVSNSSEAITIMLVCKVPGNSIHIGKSQNMTKQNRVDVKGLSPYEWWSE